MGNKPKGKHMIKKPNKTTKTKKRKKIQRKRKQFSWFRTYIITTMSAMVGQISVLNYRHESLNDIEPYKRCFETVSSKTLGKITYLGPV